jgi:hypothetical protein
MQSWRFAEGDEGRRESVSDVSTSPRVETTWKVLPPTHGALEWTGGGIGRHWGPSLIHRRLFEGADTRGDVFSPDGLVKGRHRDRS